MVCCCPSVVKYFTLVSANLSKFVLSKTLSLSGTFVSLTIAISTLLRTLAYTSLAWALAAFVASRSALTLALSPLIVSLALASASSAVKKRSREVLIA